MAAKSVLLKLTPEVHAAVQEAAKAHKRSMQSVLCTVIEKWLEQGAPDPLTNQQAASGRETPEAVDEGARRAIEVLSERVREIQLQVLDIAQEPMATDLWSRRMLSDLRDIRLPETMPKEPLIRQRRRRREQARLLPGQGEEGQ